MANSRANSVVIILMYFALFGLCPAAFAQSPAPDTTQLIEALKPKGKTREFKMLTPAELARVEKQKKIVNLLRRKGTRGLSVDERSDLSDVVSDKPSVDLEVYFDYNSAVVANEAKPTLASLGEALRAKELKGQSFLLAGHTDAIGAQNYNQDLSERRALAVKNYLIENFGATESEIVATGYGEEHLKMPNDPNAAQNRRVQVINLGE